VKSKTEIRFICIFILLLLSGQALYYFSKNKSENIIVKILSVGPSVQIINLITSDDPVVQKGNEICNKDLCMAVNTGCDGMEGILIVVAAMIAFPMILRIKIVGTMLGILMVYLTNIVRILMLYFVLNYKPGWFDFMHIYVGQVMVIFVGGVFFFLWVNQFARQNKPAAN